MTAAAEFAHVNTWVFDLDNTLYPPDGRLFAQVERRMTAWVAEELGVTDLEADRLRHHYWQSYGTTLAGLMEEHGVDPGPYLTHVHEIDFSVLEADLSLAAAIAALPGRRIVFTNGTAAYAARVLEARGLDRLIDAVYGIEQAGFRPKPHEAAFTTVFALDGLVADRAAMFEDDARNLAVPHAMGLSTIHVAPEPAPAPHIHHHTNDLAAFLANLGTR